MDKNLLIDLQHAVRYAILVEKKVKRIVVVPLGTEYIWE